MSWRPKPLGSRYFGFGGPRRSATTRYDDQGFTLVEALVASAVLALFLSVLFRGVVNVRSAANAFDTRAQARFVAQSLMDETLSRRGTRRASTSGFRDGMRWTMTMTSFDLANQLPAAKDPPANGAGSVLDPAEKRQKWATQRVAIKVETEGRPVELETIRLVKAP